jgi:endonuclease/exonuclease/phosphatase family metal-dependent hydrolase
MQYRREDLVLQRLSELITKNNCIMKQMKHMMAACTALFFLMLSTRAQVNITTAGTAYTQNFNTLPVSGTVSTLPAGWRLLETGANANTTHTANNGASTTGDTYNYGTTSNSDRALGTLQSGSLISTIGVQVRNSTGQTITSITITYTGEQWRCGATGRGADQLDFQYSTSATSLSTGTWTDVNTLDFASPNVSSTGAKDGNAAGNRTVKTATITGLSIANNALFWLRWNDLNATSSDDGLSVDDFSLTLNGAATDVTPPALASLNPLNSATGVGINSNLLITFNENIQKGTGNILVKRLSDNATIHTIGVTSASVTVSGATATIAQPGLANATAYYVEIAAGAFKDLANNNYAGFSGSSAWSFTTIGAPAVSVSPASLAFGYTPSGTRTAAQTFTLSTSNLNAMLVLAAPTGFELSRDGVVYFSSVSYQLPDLQNPRTVWVRFAPATANTSFNGQINFSSTGLNTNAVTLTGTTIAAGGGTADSLKVVCWNIEWFGGSLGPSDDNLQEQNVKTVLQNINADVYGLGEIVSESRLQSVVNAMPGYAYKISYYCSNGATSTSCASAQKLAFIYRTSKVNFVRAYPMLLNGSANASYNWSSGRFPYLMEADVTLNGVTKRVQFVMLHAKANTSDYVVSYNRRRDGAQELHDSLNAQFGASNWIVMGDYNDDLDVTITTQVAPNTETSYRAFKNDPANFKLLTLPLSLAGLKSTVSFNDVIDHITCSNEMNNYYVASSASILRTQVEGWVASYGTTTSDHYPVLTKYFFNSASPISSYVQAAPENIVQPLALQVRTVQQPGRSMLDVYVSEKENLAAELQLIDMNGRVLYRSKFSTAAGWVKIPVNTGALGSGIYIVRVQTVQGSVLQKLFVGRE